MRINECKFLSNCSGLMVVTSISNDNATQSVEYDESSATEHTPGYMYPTTMTWQEFSYRYGRQWIKQCKLHHFQRAKRDNSLEHYRQPGALQVIDSLANQTLDSKFYMGNISYATGEWDHLR
ncbi:hypothetical protein SELMODRAFT_410927 [Selaginella moellendorffii]|uniref:Uncharacterized protein n=1 Tax=Selaginella moellendorffii TaxID=88036 RepID=D8RGB3_SELML|nr:hypothetical protein SELMODRAFT_410927 [Selaginella moellendorffii]